MRRYTLVFIDDEEVIRESFFKLTNWGEYAFDVVGVFKNGESAWEYLDEHPVDIVVTDISMPFMDGISLLEKLRKKGYHTRCIFLTGYERFEYAQKAVQMQAFDFLLKPVTKESLFNAVTRAAFDIEKEEAVHEEAGKGRSLTRSAFFRKLLYGKLDKQCQEAKNLGIYCDRGSYLLMMMTVDVKEGRNMMDGELEEWIFSFKEEIRRCKEKLETSCEKHFQLYFAKDSSPNIPIILISEEKKLFSEAFVQNFADCLFEMQEQHPQYRVILVADSCRERMQELTESFGRVDKVAQRRHTFSGNGWKLVFAADYIIHLPEEEKIQLPTDTLLQHIRMGMPEEVREDIKKIYDVFRHRAYLSLSSAKMVTTELAVTAFKGETTDSDNSVSYLYYLNHIQRLNTLEELENDITEFAVNIANRRRNTSNYKRDMADRAVEYLKNNYAKEGLCLNDVAEYLNISVAYLTLLLKQETEQNFGMHLLSIRMEKAKELLRTTAYSIAEISERVGYSSSQYFAVKFKKYVGVSPVAYRDSNRKS